MQKNALFTDVWFVFCLFTVAYGDFKKNIFFQQFARSFAFIPLFMLFKCFFGTFNPVFGAVLPYINTPYLI